MEKEIKTVVGVSSPKIRYIVRGSCSRIKLKRKMHPFSLMSKGERKLVNQYQFKKHEDGGSHLKEDSIFIMFFY